MLDEASQDAERADFNKNTPIVVDDEMNNTIAKVIDMIDQTGRSSDFRSISGALATGVVPIDNIAF